MTTLQLESKKKILLGAIHLPSFLTLEKREDIDAVEAYAVKNARIFEEGGFDGVFIQDQTEGPATAKSVALLAAMTRYVTAHVNSIAIGSQMECDDAASILSVAQASGASFVRIKSYVGTMIKDRGLVHGQCHTAYSYKKMHGVEALIFADIFDRCSVPLGDMSLESAAKYAIQKGANALVITGKDYEETLEMLSRVKKAFPKVRTICGGGVTKDNIAQVFSLADGAVVSSSLKSDDDPDLWSVSKIQDLVAHAAK
jgi:hypothetical protein